MDYSSINITIKKLWNLYNSVAANKNSYLIRTYLRGTQPLNPFSEIFLCHVHEKFVKKVPNL